jgi:hypothetical protein
VLSLTQKGLEIKVSIYQSFDSIIGQLGVVGMRIAQPMRGRCYALYLGTGRR